MVELAMVELCFRSRPSDIFETRHAATQSVTAAKGLSRAVHPFRDCLHQQSPHIPGTPILAKLENIAPTLKKQHHQPVILIVANRQKQLSLDRRSKRSSSIAF